MLKLEGKDMVPGAEAGRGEGRREISKKEMMLDFRAEKGDE